MDPLDTHIKELHSEAPDLLRQREDEEAIVTHLIEKGVDRHYAELIVENVKSDASDRKEFYKHMVLGLFTAFAGLAMTIISYQATVPGGMYFIFPGLMVAGIIMVTRGIILFRRK